MAENVLNRLIRSGKWIWDKFDGKKRMLGLLITLTGLILNRISFFDPVSSIIIITGLNLLGFGLIHKAAKI